MTAPTPTVTVYFGLTAGGGSFFTLDSSTKGLLDGATYTLSGDVGTDITSYVRSVQITRGRARELDEITAGVATVKLNNATRRFDPSYASGPYYGNITPGKRVTIQAAGITVYDGQIDDWNFDYPITLDSTAEFETVDSLGLLAAKDFDAWTTTASQTVGSRLTSILNRTEVSFPSNRSIATGTSTLQADNVSWGSNVLNYCQLVVKCDLGRFFAAKDGVLTFLGRNTSATGAGAPKFADDGTGIPFSAVAVDFGTELLFTRVSVDATGFAKQTVSDSTAIDTYGVRTLSLANLPLETAAQANDLANYLLNLYKSPTSRFSSLTVNLHALTAAQQTSVLNLDIGSVVEVVYTPNDVSTAIDKFCMVEGVNHLIGPLFHQVTFTLSNLSDGFGGQPFLLDDATYGVLDTGIGLLAF